MQWTCSPVRYVRLLNPGVKERVNPKGVISGSGVSTACHLQTRWHIPAQESTNCGSRVLDKLLLSFDRSVCDFPQFLQDNAGIMPLPLPSMSVTVHYLFDLLTSLSKSDYTVSKHLSSYVRQLTDEKYCCLRFLVLGSINSPVRSFNHNDGGSMYL
jgi:hypothetical protein